MEKLLKKRGEGIAEQWRKGVEESRDKKRKQLNRNRRGEQMTEQERRRDRKRRM